MNNHIVTMTYNEGVIDQLITVINLETEEILTTYPATMDNYVEIIIKLCKMYNTELICCDDDLYDSTFATHHLILVKEGEIIPYENESEENE